VAGRPVEYLSWTALTYPFNVTGYPAASVPCGRSAEGLPVGLQIVGRRGDEALVLRAARSFERLTPWDYEGLER
jgi:aspartyl-tRNA(Asn)/glutamyl-tRNA(Gln) amidotransferase subunit A